MNKTSNKKLTGASKALRNNMTKEEKRLWYEFLKALPQTVNRQKVIGDYIVDFYCASAQLVIEIDGSQHYTQPGKQKDLERDEYLNSLGIRVLRYSNLDVQRNFEGVCADILRYINTSSVTLRVPPSPQGEG